VAPRDSESFLVLVVSGSGSIILKVKAELIEHFDHIVASRLG
jgi:hypothetical protein